MKLKQALENAKIEADLKDPSAVGEALDRLAQATPSHEFQQAIVDEIIKVPTKEAKAQMSAIKLEV